MLPSLLASDSNSKLATSAGQQQHQSPIQQQASNTTDSKKIRQHTNKQLTT
jgi:hypothetical protein